MEFDPENILTADFKMILQMLAFLLSLNIIVNILMIFTLVRNIVSWLYGSMNNNNRR